MIQNLMRKLPLNINRREQMFIMAGAGFILVFLVFLLLIEPVFQKRARLLDKITQKQQSLVEMRMMRSEYQALESRSREVQQLYSERPEDFTLFSFMDRLAGETGIKDNISYMKPGSTQDQASGASIASVELKLEDVTMKELTSYLYHVETSKSMVRIEKLSISGDGEENRLLTVVMQAKTLET